MLPLWGRGMRTATTSLQSLSTGTAKGLGCKEFSKKRLQTIKQTINATCRPASATKLLLTCVNPKTSSASRSVRTSSASLGRSQDGGSPKWHMSLCHSQTTTSNPIHAAARLACSMYASPDLAGLTVTTTGSSPSASFSTGGLYTILHYCTLCCSTVVGTSAYDGVSLCELAAMIAGRPGAETNGGPAGTLEMRRLFRTSRRQLHNFLPNRTENHKRRYWLSGVSVSLCSFWRRPLPLFSILSLWARTPTLSLFTRDRHTPRQGLIMTANTGVLALVGLLLLSSAQAGPRQQALATNRSVAPRQREHAAAWVLPSLFGGPAVAGEKVRVWGCWWNQWAFVFISGSLFDVAQEEQHGGRVGAAVFCCTSTGFVLTGFIVSLRWTRDFTDNLCCCVRL